MLPEAAPTETNRKAPSDRGKHLKDGLASTVLQAGIDFRVLHDRNKELWNILHGSSTNMSPCCKGVL